MGPPVGLEARSRLRTLLCLRSIHQLATGINEARGHEDGQVAFDVLEDDSSIPV